MRAFPLEHKKLMFMFMIMLMLMILMSLVGTKLYDTLLATLFSPRARAQLARYLWALRAGGLVRLCCSTWLVAVGGDEAWYVSRPCLKQKALTMQQSSGGDFLSFC